MPVIDKKSRDLYYEVEGISFFVESSISGKKISYAN